MSVKLVSEVGVGTDRGRRGQGHADHILISGHDGGTGASPHRHQARRAALGARPIRDPSDPGDERPAQPCRRADRRADQDGAGRRNCRTARCRGVRLFHRALIAMGCIMMRKCEKNTCPVGIATQTRSCAEVCRQSPADVTTFSPSLRRRCERSWRSSGSERFDEMVGRVDMLEPDTSVLNWKPKHRSFPALLQSEPVARPTPASICCMPQDHGIDEILDRTLIQLAEPCFCTRIQNPRASGPEHRPCDRDMLSHQLTKRGVS